MASSKKPAKPTVKRQKKATASPSAGAATGRMMPAASGVRVRMYCQGLGDCFLLCFRGKLNDPVYMLIDCGVILGTSNAQTIMAQVVTDILKATGGHIHYLLGTHQHWDHLSGFIQAQEQFDQLKVDNIWLAWTEDPSNQLARELRGQREKTRAALTAVVNRMAGLPGMAGQAKDIRQVLEFFGEAPGGNSGVALSAAATKGPNTQAALDYLSARPNAQVKYRHPGEDRIALPEVEHLRIYVLGPPEDEKLIKQSNPSAKGKEVYELTEISTPDSFFAAACGAAAKSIGASAQAQTPDVQVDPELQLLQELSFPFDQRFRITEADAKRNQFFQDRYFDKNPDEHPSASDQSWRRIDNDWLGVASQIALNLDSNTNNTSLAIAIELLPSRRVLLFPADAQVGNWLSWSKYSWPADHGGDKPVTSADLLGRTVFYKVGHHGSHNATLREQGLELMQSEDLVAMIPVDHDMAVKKGWGKMPFDPLLKRLTEKTRGRIIRIDKGIAKRPDDVSAAQWEKFTAQIKQEPRDDGKPLYFEYVVSG